MPASTTDMDMRRVLAIGASTGGIEALKVVLAMLPERIPPTVVVQHIPSGFSKALAVRLNETCPFEVKEAEDGDELRPSRVLIAPGGLQMKVARRSSGLFVRVTDDPPLRLRKPSVDFLFSSVASVVGRNSVVYGMPKVAHEIGAVARIAPLIRIEPEILSALSLSRTSRG